MAPPIVKRYLIALDKYKLLLLGSLAVGVSTAGVIAMQAPPPSTLYNASGALAFNSSISPFSSLAPQILTRGTQLNEELLLPEFVIKKVSEKTNVDPNQLLKNIQIKLPKPPSTKAGAPKETGPQLIQLQYVDQNPKVAGLTLKLLMEEMIEQSRLRNTAGVEAIIKSISDRLPKVKQQLQDAERKLERYVRTEGPAIQAAQDGTLVGAITGSQQQQRQLEMNLAGIDAQINDIQSRLGLTPEQAYTSSALSADPIIASLRAQIHQNETQLQIFSRDLRPQHPTMIELRRKQLAYEQLLQQRASEVMGGNGIAAPLTAKIRRDSSLDPARQQLANNLVTLQSQRQMLQQQLLSIRQAEQTARVEYSKAPNKQLEQARLQQQVQIHQSLYSKMEVSLADAQVAQAETVSSLTVAKPPQLTPEVKPGQSFSLTMAAGAGLGLLVGGGLIFWLASLDSTLYSCEELKSALAQREVPLLAELPLMNFQDLAPDEIPALLSPDSPYLEFYERLRSNLRTRNNPLQVLLITSAQAGEGKTVTAYNLGVASARAGKRTLLIEADLRSPSNARSVKVAADPEAMIEPLHYYGQMSECIRLVPDVENLYIIPSVGSVRSAAAILESSELQRLLADARGRFDLVIVDTPPLSTCNDALTLLPYTDGMVLVTRPGYTHDNFLGEAVDQISEADLPLLGAAINGVDKYIPIPVAPRNIEAPIETEATEAIAQDVPESEVKKSAMKL